MQDDEYKENYEGKMRKQDNIYIENILKA